LHCIIRVYFSLWIGKAQLHAKLTNNTIQYNTSWLCGTSDKKNFHFDLSRVHCTRQFILFWWK